MQITSKRFEKPGEWEVTLPLRKKKEEVQWRGVVDARAGGEYALRVEALHLVSNTTSRVVVKAVAGKGARVKVEGVLKIAKEAQGTESFVELRALVVDETASVELEPKLEIEANAVKAGHAASVTRFDEGQINYLRGRGLTREEAEKEIVEGWVRGE